MVLSGPTTAEAAKQPEMTSTDAEQAERIAEHRRQFSFLTRLRMALRLYAIEAHRLWLVKVWGMHIGEGVAISLQAKLDKANPKGIYIGRDSAVVFGSAVLAHDYVRNINVDTRIGERCQIGAHAIIFPGVTIGDGSVVAAGSVVMRDVPAGSLVFGNPARVMESGLVTGKWGIILGRTGADGKPTGPTPGTEPKNA